MSFECQEGASTCGLASLKYAFSLLGAGLRRNRELEEDDVRTRMGKSAWRVFREGTGEDELTVRRAADKLVLVIKFRRYHERDADPCHGGSPPRHQSEPPLHRLRPR